MTKHTLEVPQELAIRMDGRRNSRFDVSFDKLSHETLPPNPNLLDQIASPTTQILSLRRTTSVSSEVEVRIVNRKPPVKQFQENRKHSESNSDCCFCTYPGVRSNGTHAYLNERHIDHYLESPQTTAVTFMKLTMGSTLFLIGAFVWIEFLMSPTFSREILVSGAFESFPVHYALLIDALLGLGDALLIVSLACKGLLVGRVKHVLYGSLVVPLFGLLCLFYTLGGSILFADQLEDRMLMELHTVGGQSALWRGSQKFFECCGVTSRNDWLWNHPFDRKDFVFPTSCCRFTEKNKICNFRKTMSSRNGCLDSEMDLLLGISYSLLILASFHFVFELFGWMQLAKLYFRQKFRRKHLQSWTDASTFSSDFPVKAGSKSSKDSTKTKVLASQSGTGGNGIYSESYLVQSRKFNLTEETTLIKSSSTAN